MNAGEAYYFRALCHFKLETTWLGLQPVIFSQIGGIFTIERIKVVDVDAKFVSAFKLVAQVCRED